MGSHEEKKPLKIPPLKREWIDAIFSRLHGIYGSAFTGKYSTGANRDGIDDGLENAKAVWAEELAGFKGQPDAIACALKNTDPKFAPSSREFLALCRMSPPPVVTALPHKLSEDERAHNRERLAKIAQGLYKKWGGE